MTQSIKAVVFDLDGLVIDSESSFRIAWQQGLEAMGYQVNSSFLLNLSGHSGDMLQLSLQNQFGSSFDFEHFRKVAGYYWQQHIQQYGLNCKPGIFNLLALLTELHLPHCLATNSSRLDAINGLSLAGLADAFQIILSKEDVIAQKPAPDIFIKAASILGVPLHNCLVLEDSAVGVAAAYAAGTPCIYIPSTEKIDPNAADQALVVLADLEQASLFVREISHVL